MIQTSVSIAAVAFLGLAGYAVVCLLLLNHLRKRNVEVRDFLHAELAKADLEAYERLPSYQQLLYGRPLTPVAKTARMKPRNWSLVSAVTFTRTPW